MTVLKALKKIFGKSEAEPLAPASTTPEASQGSRSDAQQPARPAPEPGAVNTPAAPSAPEPQRIEKPKVTKPRPEVAPKPPVIPWKLEDFVVEPQEGKTRFHDFNLAPELMHAIQDLAFLTSLREPGMLASSRRYAQVTDLAPWRIEVRLQSMAVSPPPSTTTFLPFMST